MDVPFWLRLFALVLGLIIATPLLLSGIGGLRGTLRRGGVRTVEARRSEGAFRVANRVAGLPWIVGGAIAAVGGLACLVVPGTASVLIVLIVALLGALVISFAGGMLGHRAAMAVPEPDPAPNPCAGCLCGGGGCGVAAS